MNWNCFNKESYLEKYLIDRIKNLFKISQTNIGATIISCAPITIFLIIVILNLKNIKILNIMSSFPVGTLILYANNKFALLSSFKFSKVVLNFYQFSFSSFLIKLHYIMNKSKNFYLR